MLLRCFIAVLGVLVLTSCQFTETMVINEDGSGRMSVSVDLKEMMAFSNEMGGDSTMVKMDTIVRMKDFIAEKKDSIAQLSPEEQAKIAKLAPYEIRTLMDPETEEMFVDIYTNFSSVSEANDLMNAFEKSGDFMPSMGSDTEITQDPSSGGTMGVNFDFKNNVFTRDAFVKNEEKHGTQKDSLKQAEAFMSGMKYVLKYTFPRKIKEVSVDDATFSLDGKTMTLERNFLNYFKDPDVLDVRVVLEDK